MKPPELEEGSFTLRLPRPEDVSWIYHACQDAEIQRFTMVPVPYRPADAVAWVASAAEQCAVGTALHFLVSLTESGELLGAASLVPVAGDSDVDSDIDGGGGGRAEIGYWVDRDARRRGVASAGLAALERFASEELQVREVRLRIAVDNTGSQALALRAGYTLLGRDPEPCKGLDTLSYAKSLAISAARD